MNNVLTVLQIVAPVFLLGLVGFVWVRAGFDYSTEFVTRLAMTLAIPCLVFVSLMEAQIDPAALTTLSLATLAAYGTVTVIMTGLGVLLRLPARTYLSPLIFGNTGNLGLPLALFAFGQEGLTYAIIIFAIMAVWNFTFGVWLVSGGDGVLKIVREPLVGATLLGGLFLWQDWQTPEFLTNTIRLVGQMAIPLMLITLGVAVARLHPQGLSRAAGLSVIKLIVCATIGWAIATTFALSPTAFGVLVLQLATPVGVTSYLLAEKYGADGPAVAALVVVSTLLAIAALPVLLGLLV